VHSAEQCNNYAKDASSGHCVNCLNKVDRLNVLQNIMERFDSKIINNIPTPPKNETNKIKSLLEGKYGETREESAKRFEKAIYNPYYWEYELIKQRSKVKEKLSEFFGSEPEMYIAISEEISALKDAYNDYSSIKSAPIDFYASTVIFGSIYMILADVHSCSLEDESVINELYKRIENKKERQNLLSNN